MHFMGITSVKKVNRILKKNSNNRERPFISKKIKRTSLRLANEDNMRVYYLNEEQATSSKHIIYIHGGAYILGLNNTYMNYCEKFSNDLNCVVSVLDYPLLPESSYKIAYEKILHHYKCVSNDKNVEDIIIVGDSAGGRIALGLTQLIIKEKLPIPKVVVLFSPWVDITMRNPEIDYYRKKDCVLNKEALIEIGKLWSNNEDRKNFLLSPIYGEMKGIRKVILAVGTNEIFLPDVRLLKEKLNEVCVDCVYYEYPDMTHAFNLLINIGLKEADDLTNKIIEDLKS